MEKLCVWEFFIENGFSSFYFLFSCLFLESFSCHVECGRIKLFLGSWVASCQVRFHKGLLKATLFNCFLYGRWSYYSRVENFLTLRLQTLPIRAIFAFPSWMKLLTLNHYRNKILTPLSSDCLWTLYPRSNFPTISSKAFTFKPINIT